MSQRSIQSGGVAEMIETARSLADANRTGPARSEPEIVASDIWNHRWPHSAPTPIISLSARRYDAP
jgi:hypothetical protein